MIIGQLLLVDDDSNLCQSLTHILKGAHYNITCLTNAEEALAYLRAGYYDLALVDLTLPDMDGLDLVEHMLNLHANLPVIVLTGRGSLDDAVRCIRLGVRDFLVKPVEPDFLIERVAVALAARRDQQHKEEALERIQKLVAQLVEKHHPAEAADDPPAVLENNRNGRYIYRGDLKVDQISRTIHCGDKEVVLSDTSFSYLMVLMRHAPRAVSFNALVNEAQGYRVTPVEAKGLVFWHIYTLRQDLAKLCQSKCYIVNVRGYGYKFTESEKG